MKTQGIEQTPTAPQGRSEAAQRLAAAVSDKTEMLKALAAYSGPIKQCQPGGARGANDLRTWALRRAGGRSGVPDGDTARKIKKAAYRLKKKTRLYERFMASPASRHTTFQAWLKSRKPPSVWCEEAA